MKPNRKHYTKLLSIALLLLSPLGLNAQQNELRGLWVDAWGTGFKTPGQVDQLIADAKAGNYNAIFPQVRKRGDAYYNSLIEPKATDINSGFDPLANLIQKAHAANPPIQVHAWIVAYPLWGVQSIPPTQSTHVYNNHPGWLTRNSSGATWDGSNYQLDPGHPAVQNHLFDISMDIVSRYNVDGLQLDYIRYSGASWGYNPVAVNRFNSLHGRTGQPGTSDSAWLQFRRDQVTDLVRKIYLSTIDLKPHVTVSAATITWGSGITSTSQWTSSSAYSSVLQDWRAWMEEGILDLNIPMTYYRQPTHANAYRNWNIFAKNHAYDRHVAIGPGHYLNSIADSMTQITIARQTTAAGNKAQGIVGYSHRVTNKDGDPRSAFLSALTASGGSGDFIVDNSDSGFSASANWSTGTAASGKYGSNYRYRNVQATSDAASWTVNLPSAGSYEIYAWWSAGGNRSSTAPYIVDHSGGSATVYRNQQIAGGQWNLLGAYNLNAGSNQVRLSCWTTNGTIVIADAIRWKSAGGGGGPFSAPATVPVMTWKTNPQQGHLKGFVNNNGSPVDGASITLTGTVNRTGHTDATGFYGFVDLPPGSYTVAASKGSLGNSGNVSITAGNVTHRNLGLAGGGPTVIVDNSDSGFSASANWSTSSSASDKYGANYRHRATASISDLATWTATLPSSGTYKVYAWWTAGSNRASAAPYFVDHSGGAQLVYKDQRTNGGQWNLLGTFQMNAGSNQVRLSCWTSSGNVVIADAVKWEKQ